MCEECAKEVIEILDKMEADGRFHGLTEDEKEKERTLLGMRMRRDTNCPNVGVNPTTDLEQIIRDKISEIKSQFKRHEGTYSDLEKEKMNAVIINLENVLLIKRQREVHQKVGIVN